MEQNRIKELNLNNNYRVYVSKEEWEKLDVLAKLELIALSNMTGEDILNNLSHGLNKLYDKLVYGVEDDED